MEKISRYPVPAINELPEDVQAILNGVQENVGFVPNVMSALSHRPDELKAFLAYGQALEAKESGLTEAEKEMLIVAFSNVNGCTYCVTSHGTKLRMLTQDERLVDQVKVNYREANITPRQKAMIDFAMKVSNNSRDINEGDFEVLRSHDFSNEDIWDIAGITAFYNLSNRMMNFLAVLPDAEFYKMGRD